MAIGLCGIFAIVGASMMSLFAQNRAANTRARAVIDVQRAVGKVLSSPQACSDALRLAAIDAAAAGSPWTPGAGTLTMSRIAVGVLSAATTSAGTTFTNLYIRKNLAPNDSSAYVRDMYLANPAPTAAGSIYYYQAFVDVLSPAPPRVSAGSFDESRSMKGRPLLVGTVMLTVTGGTFGCSIPTASAPPTAVPIDKTCRPNTRAVAYDPSNQALTCVPILSNCYYSPYPATGTTMAGEPGNELWSHQRYVGTTDASPKPTARPTSPAVSCPTGEAFVSPKNCVIDTASGNWACSIWCAKVNCDPTI